MEKLICHMEGLGFTVRHTQKFLGMKMKGSQLVKKGLLQVRGRNENKGFRHNEILEGHWVFFKSDIIFEDSEHVMLMTILNKEFHLSILP